MGLRLRGSFYFYLFFSIAFSANLNAATSIKNAKISPFTITSSTSNFNGYNISCNGKNDGFIDITITGGTSPFTYSWSNGETTEDINSLTSGNYKVIVIDNDGDTDSLEINLTQPDLLNANVDSSNNVLCAGTSTGAIFITPNGGVSPFNYSWSDGNSTEDISLIAAGSYTVLITDNNGCSATATSAITEPLPLSILTDSTTNVSCNGALNGFIYLHVAGGLPNYSYLWNDGSTSENRPQLNGGIYSLTITDGNSCTDSFSISISEPSPISINIDSVFNISCNGFSNGQIFTSTSGGTGSLSYLWSNGSTDASISFLNAGTYSVTVSDSNLCSVSTSQLITEPSLFKIDSFIVTDVRCFNGNDGSIDVTTSGGTPPYSFFWSDGSTNEDNSNLTSGNYFINVTDKNGCGDFAFIQVFQPAFPLTTQLDSSFGGCNGTSDGAIYLSSHGGTGPYSYLWSNGATTDDITSLSAGTYSVTVTDVNGCTFSLQVPLVFAPPLSATIDSIKNNSCVGLYDGVLVVTASGGLNPYSYLWSIGATSDTLKLLPPGIFVVTITDFNGCTATTSAEIIAPDSIFINTNSTPTTCNLLNGSTSAIATGGTGLFQYLWNTGSTNSVISNLAAGTYTVTTNDANNCTSTASVVVNSIAPPVISIQNSTDPKCFGSNDGSISVSVANGTTPFGFLWSNGSTNQNQVALTGGLYSVTVTDFNNCTSSVSALLSAPANINISFTTSSVTCNLSNGSATATANGGTGLIQYLWNNGSTNSTLNNVAAGTYTLTATDANNCSATSSAVVNSIAPPVISIQNSTNPKCFGSTDGSISVSIANGTSPFIFLWSNGSTNQNQGALPAGLYSVTVTDFNNCTSTVSALLTSPAGISISFTVSSTTCNLINGSATATATGGTGLFQYLWNNGSTISTINNLAAGTYTVTATDANNCTATASVVVNSIAPPLISIQNSSNPKCFGSSDGSISVAVANGTPTFSFLWSNGSTNQNQGALIAGLYTVTVTDFNNCTSTVSALLTAPTGISISFTTSAITCNLSNGNASAIVTGGTGSYQYLWNNGSTNSSINNLAAGTYTVTANDANNCTTSASVLVNSIAPPILSIQNFTNPSCFGSNNGSISVTVANGAPPFTYLWSNGSTNQNQTALIAGLYSVTVTDFNNCTATASQLISSPANIVISFTVTPATCNQSNGDISATINGGVPGYNLIWSNGSTSTSINNIASASYTLTVTDQTGCTSSKAVFVGNTGAPTAIIQLIKDVKCHNGSDGSINVFVSGGSLPYSYLWSNGATTEDISNLPAGTYTLVVTDFNTCQSSLLAVVTQPDSIAITINSINTTCGLTNGSASATAIGGTGILSYLWNTGSVATTISSLTPGSYTVSVVDQSLCSSSLSAQIASSSVFAISVASFNNVSCFGGNDGFINTQLTGGTAPFNYSWSNGNSSANLNNASFGTYTVSVTDFNNCNSTISKSITQPSQINIISNSTNTTCGFINGSVSANASGGTGLITYLWNTGSTNQSIPNLSSGVYTVVVTDQNSCTASASVSVNPSTSPSISLLNAVNPKCFGNKNGSINITVTGGTFPYNFLWSNSETTQNISSLYAGTYTILVTDFTGCTSTFSYTLTDPDSITMNVTITNATCGLNNGSAVSVVTGGTGTISYLWSTGSTISAINNLAPGGYTLFVFDQNGCNKNSSFSISNIAGPTLSIDSFANVSCNGNSNGYIFIKTSGGTIPFSFSWSNGATSQNIVNLAPGVYTTTITDFNNCTSTISKSIIEPNVLSVSISGTNTTCSLSNGLAIANPTGGTAPYFYLWSNSNTNQNISALAAGIYFVTVTDFNNCTATSSVEILGSDSISLSIASFTNSSCFGTSDGNISVILSGGSPLFNYLWSNGSTNLNLSNIVSGNYTLIVTDSKNCVASISQIISQPSQIQTNPTVNQPSCGLSNGSINLSPTGGSGVYSYFWSNGKTTQTINNLTGAAYTVTITDNTNCTVSSVILVGNSNGPQITIDSLSMVSCFGQNNGAISVKVNGGQLPYDYLWSNGLTVEDISNLTANTYSLTVTDNVGCSGITSVSITEPLQLQATLSSYIASCGLDNGAIKALVTSGVFPYNYLWSNAATTDSIYNLSSGSYSLTITDFNGCTLSSTAIVNETPAVIIFTDSVKMVSCNGGNNGSINIHTSGGSSFTYNWSNGCTDQDAHNLVAGNYSVTVTNNFGCNDTMSFTITEPTALSLSLSSTPSTCSNANGIATVVASGGTGIYSYLWSNSVTTSINNNLLGSVMTVTVTDENGCIIKDSITVENLAAPIIQTAYVHNISCYGLHDGVIDLSVIGSATPFTYLWSNGSTVKDIGSLYSGTYTITVTDTNNCVSVFDTTLTQPDSIIINYTVGNPTCGLANGYIALNVTGGVSPYSYVWTFGSTADSIYNLDFGNYFVSVIDSISCVNSESFVLQNAVSPQINLDSTKDVSCYGFNDGNIYLSITSSSNPLTVLWSNGNTTQNNLNLLAGTYTVTVTDSNNCSIVGSYVINGPVAPLSVNLDKYNPSCGLVTGSLAALSSGGTFPYSYLWSNSDTSDSISQLPSGIYSVLITDKNGCSIIANDTLTNTPGVSIVKDSTTNVKCFEENNGAIYLTITGGDSFTYQWSNGDSTEDIFNLIASSYFVIVTNNFGCSDTASYQISEPTKLTTSVSSTPSTCSVSNGSATVSASGGTPPYSYLWSNSVTTSTNSNLNGIALIVTVTDAHNCSQIDSVVVADLAAPIISTSLIQNISCYGLHTGVIDVTVSGASTPFSYLWSNASTTEDLNSLPAGIYTLTVTDTNNCVTTYDTTLVQPDSILINYTLDNPHCGLNNGYISLSVTGGVAPYVYLWNFGSNADSIFNLDAGNYFVTVIDSLGCSNGHPFVLVNEMSPLLNLDSVQNISCNGLSDGSINLSIISSYPPLNFLWSNSSTTLNINNLAPGVYTLTVTDINNCTTVFQDSISQPDSLTIAFITTYASCVTSNGTAAATIFGGTPPYQYLWNDGTTDSNIDSLSVGTYTLTITDAHFCTLIDSVVISNPNAPLITNSAITNVNCFNSNNGAISLDVTSSNLPLNYLWSNFETTEDLQNLAYGTYTITITDASSCSSSQIFLVNQPDEIIATISTIDASCNDSNGTAYIAQITGGVGPFTYLWNTGATTDSITQLPANNYTLTITDVNGCSKIANANINNLSGPVITLNSLTQINCFGDSSGAIDISATGIQLNFAWSNSETTEDISNLIAGTYTITVTDANNCKAISSYDIISPDSISLNAVLSNNNPPYNVSCYGATDGYINLSPSGGAPPYTFQWSISSTNQNLSSISAGLFVVVVTDGTGCTKSASYTLTQPPQLLSNAGTNQIICGEDSFQLNAAVPTYGTGSWLVISGSGTFSDIHSATAVVSGLSIGINSLAWIVSDGICADTSIINISITQNITANAGIDKSICEKSITLSATKPQFGYGFWNIIAGTGEIADTLQSTTPATNLNYGPNTFQWTVVNGTCVDSDWVVIFVLDSISCLQPVELPTGFTPNGDGKNDYYVIKNILEYPQNLLSIYNRWGNLVYQKQNYQNEWSGTNNSDQPLPDGTYYIMLTIKNISKPYKQYVDLRR